MAGVKIKNMANIKADKIPSWAVGVIAVAGVLAVGGAAYIVYKAVKKQKENKDERDVKNEASNELKDAIASNIKPSWPDSVYRSTADLIQQKLDGCESPFSTAELDVVKELLRVVKNQADWLKLVNTFGVREIADCGSWGMSKTKYNLGGLLKDQLDSSFGMLSEKLGDKSYTGQYLSLTPLKEQFAKRNINW